MDKLIGFQRKINDTIEDLEKSKELNNIYIERLIGFQRKINELLKI